MSEQQPGLVGFRCPPGTPTAGNENEFEHCIKHCPHQCLPTAVLYTIKEQNVHNVHKGSMISPTALPRCPRKLKLTRLQSYYEEPHKLYHATRGSLYHGFLECKGLEGVQTEQRIYKVIESGPYAPWVLSGCFDFYDETLHQLQDFKSIQDKGLRYLLDDGPKEEHVLQLNCYRWLMDGGRMGGLDGEQVFLPVNSMMLNYIMMGTCVSTGRPFTQQVVQYKAPIKYRYEISRKSIGTTASNKTIWELTYRIPDVPVMDLESVEQYIMLKGPTLVRGFREEDFIPDGVMDDPDNNWECRWCPVKKECDDIEASRITVARHPQQGSLLALEQLEPDPGQAVVQGSAADLVPEAKAA